VEFLKIMNISRPFYCGNSDDIILASSYQYPNRPPVTIYTRSIYLWLGYLKHCIGNIDNAIHAELALS
jgi:hypothetical protein